MYKPVSQTKEPQNTEKAYEYAVFLLSLKLCTVGEVLKKMEARGYGQLIIEEVIERLKAQNYLDDQKYAEVFLENLKAYKNYGYYGIKKKFMEKRIPNDLIESTLQNGLPIKEEIKIAQRFLLRYSPPFQGGARGGYFKESQQGNPSPLAQDDADDENQYQTFNEDSSKEKQKLANRLKSRGFRSEVISKLIF